jgi:hypothetical protein
MTEPRSAKPTVKFVDDYCQWYQPIFPEVRSFEAFRNLHNTLPSVWGKTLIFRWLYPRKLVNLSESDGRAL